MNPSSVKEGDLKVRVCRVSLPVFPLLPPHTSDVIVPSDVIVVSVLNLIPGFIVECLPKKQE